MSTKNLNINGLTEIDDVLAMIADKVVYGDKDGAVDSINELRDYFEEQSADKGIWIEPSKSEREEGKKPYKTSFPDARDHHLINQDFNRAFGGKK